MVVICRCYSAWCHEGELRSREPMGPAHSLVTVRGVTSSFDMLTVISVIL